MCLDCVVDGGDLAGGVERERERKRGEGGTTTANKMWASSSHSTGSHSFKLADGKTRRTAQRQKRCTPKKRKDTESNRLGDVGRMRIRIKVAHPHTHFLASAAVAAPNRNALM